MNEDEISIRRVGNVEIDPRFPAAHYGNDLIVVERRVAAHPALGAPYTCGAYQTCIAHNMIGRAEPIYAAGKGCPREPAGSDGLTCPDPATGRALCDPPRRTAEACTAPNCGCLDGFCQAPQGETQ